MTYPLDWPPASNLRNTVLRHLRQNARPFIDGIVRTYFIPTRLNVPPNHYNANHAIGMRAASASSLATYRQSTCPEINTMPIPNSFSRIPAAITLVLFFLGCPFAHGSGNPALRIACVGDSITAGARVTARTESYPAQLQDLLGPRYDVRNFGVGGATLIKVGRPTVWSQLPAIEAFKPHIVVISLGTNDTVSGKRKNWERIDRFATDYRELIQRLSALPSKPRILLCTPTDMILETPGLSNARRRDLTERRPRLLKLCSIIRQIARQEAAHRVSLLDLHSVLRGHPEWVTAGDGVHPNQAGYAAIAKKVAEAIRKLDICGDRRPPNIVLFLVDDMGWQDTSVPFHSEVTPLNRRYRTPNMEQLASQGMKFVQAYACCVCSPSRVSLMTGLNAARHRVTNWTLRKNASNDRPHPRLEFPNWNVNGLSPIAGIERTVHAKALPAFLHELGYRTIHVGKAHFGAIGTPGSDPKNIGFDVNIGGHAAGGPGSYLGTQNFSAAWRNGGHVWDVPHLDRYHGQDIFLTEALTREANRVVTEAIQSGLPFFLYMSHYAVHVPFAKDARFYQRYRDAGLDHTEAMYAAMVEGMDKSLGDILKNIKQLGQLDRTVVLFMSDNGGLSASGRGGIPHTHNKPLSSGKGSAHEGGIRVPMIVSWPGVTPPGSTCDAPIIIEDFFPTILEIAGCRDVKQIGGVIDGRSFVPLLQGKPDADRRQRPLYWHFPNNWGPTGPGIGPSSTIRLGDWKLIHYYDGDRYELFHLASDLGEQHNLAESQPEVRKRLAHQLDAYLNAVDAQRPVAKMR